MSLSLVSPFPRYRVLDEVDQMMAMGFIEDVETILSAAGPDASTRIQTFLFSATMPGRIKAICKRFLKPDHHIVDIVGESKMQVRPCTHRL